MKQKYFNCLFNLFQLFKKIMIFNFYISSSMKMTDFDEKLTILHKKFYTMDCGLISDILESVGGDLSEATGIISSLIPSDEKNENSGSDQDSKKVDFNSESDEDLKAAIERSKQEDKERKDLLRQSLKNSLKRFSNIF